MAEKHIAWSLMLVCHLLFAQAQQPIPERVNRQEDRTFDFQRRQFAEEYANEQYGRALISGSFLRKNGALKSLAYYLGMMYYEGKGTPVDRAQAADLFLEAAKDGYDRAQLAIGFCFLTGSGVAQDFTKAEQWLVLASDQGNATAMAHLGEMAFQGLGQTTDFAKAEQYYYQAAIRGSGWALERFENMKRRDQLTADYGFGPQKIANLLRQTERIPNEYERLDGQTRLAVTKQMRELHDSANSKADKQIREGALAWLKVAIRDMPSVELMSLSRDAGTTILRREAVQALAGHSDDISIKNLAYLYLWSTERSIALAAAQSLAEIGTNSAVAELIRGLEANVEDDAVARIVLPALEANTGARALEVAQRRFQFAHERYTTNRLRRSRSIYATDSDIEIRAVLEAADAAVRLGDRSVLDRVTPLLVDWSVKHLVADFLSTVEWSARSDEEILYEAIALENWRWIESHFQEIKGVLTRNLSSGSKTETEHAILTLVRLGKAETVDQIAAAMRRNGTVRAAQVLLNVGQHDLEAAAHTWAREHGYTIESVRAGPSAFRWGGS